MMKTIMFWSCTGVDASELSFQTAKLMSDTEKTLIAELPCLGIPRLAFVCGVMERERHIEAAITDFEQKRSISWDMVHAVGKRLYALPASVFSTPDYPVSMRVNLDALMGFVPALQDMAKARDCGRLVLECQGQLHSPLTFFSLKSADMVVVPLGKPTEAAYALASVRRLVQVYKHRPDKFLLASTGSRKAIESAAFIGGAERMLFGGMQVTAWHSRKIMSALDSGDAGSTKDPYETVSAGAAEERFVGSRKGVRERLYTGAACETPGESPVYL